MARKVTCKNICCKHHKNGGLCAVPVRIGEGGACESYERGFHYYVNLVWNALSNTNFILPADMNDDMRIGLYYVMKMFHLGFSVQQRGDWRMVMLCNEEKGKGLTYQEIIELPLDTDVLMQLRREFDEGKLPGPDAEDDAPPPKKSSQPFGWLSPSGDFTEGDWGDHEKIAHDMIRKLGFSDEFRAYKVATRQGLGARDFLSEVKGYCLIHNPSGLGGYIVSNVKPLTKQQREFLYGYFMDMGDRFGAERFMQEE